MALQTITSEHRDIQQISIHVSHITPLDRINANTRQTTGESAYGQWLDLDRLLVRFWELRSIRPRVIYVVVSEDEEKEAIDCMSFLLPEITKRGIIDLGRHQGPR